MPVAALQDIEGFADVADTLAANNWDLRCLRPWRGKDGRSYTTRVVNGEPRVVATNAAASVTRDAWKHFDDVVQKVLYQRLSAVRDVRAAGLDYRLPNGMANTVLQYPKASDVTGASVGMRVARRSEADRPEVDLGLMPLPLVYKDFDFDARELAMSRQGYTPMPLDDTMVMLSAQKVAEEIEKMLLGTVTPFYYGGAYLYGYLTLPERAIKADFTVPTGSNGATTLSEILALRQLLINDRHYGPFVLYVNSQWSPFLDADYSTLKGTDTLRQRILALPDIQAVRTLDFLPATHYRLLLVEMQATTVRMVVGFEPYLVQWDSMGGLQKHFKLLGMMDPQVRPDAAGNSGVADGLTVAA